MRLNHKYGRFGLAILLVGCAGGHVPGSRESTGLVFAGDSEAGGARDVGPGGSGEAPAVSGEALAGSDEALAGLGSLVIRIRWPEYGLQLLPASATKVDLVVKDGNGNTLASGSVSRSGGATSASKTFERLPAGACTLSATAKNATGGTVATGTATVTIVPNRRGQATLTLTPANPPTISGFSPKAGAPGTQVSVTGSNFPTDETKMAVSLGGLDISPVQTAAFSPSQFALFVPSGATTSAISITADGIKATSAALFITLGALTLSPDTEQSGASGSATVFTVTALDTASPGQAAEGAPISWSLTNITGVNPPSGGGDGTGTGGGGGGGMTGTLGTFSTTTGTTDAQGKATTTFTAKATGSAWINVTAGTTLRATVSISIL